MALRRISHKHREDQVDRGYNILTGGELPNSLALIKRDQQYYVKKPQQVWDTIRSGTPSFESQVVPKS